MYRNFELCSLSLQIYLRFHEHKITHSEVLASALKHQIRTLILGFWSSKHALQFNISSESPIKAVLSMCKIDKISMILE